LASRVDLRLLPDSANSLFTFSNLVEEIPFIVYSLTILAISKERAASSTAESIKEEILVALNICREGPSRLVCTNFENGVEAPKMVSRRAWEELPTTWQWRLGEQCDCLLLLSCFLLFLEGLTLVFVAFLVSITASTREIGSTNSTSVSG